MSTPKAAGSAGGGVVGATKACRASPHRPVPGRAAATLHCISRQQTYRIVAHNSDRDARRHGERRKAGDHHGRAPLRRRRTRRGLKGAVTSNRDLPAGNQPDTAHMSARAYREHGRPVSTTPCCTKGLPRPHCVALSPHHGHGLSEPLSVPFRTSFFCAPHRDAGEKEEEDSNVADSGFGSAVSPRLRARPGAVRTSCNALVMRLSACGACRRQACPSMSARPPALLVAGVRDRTSARSADV